MSGRDFRDEDAEGAAVAIVNESFARSFFPDEEAVGRRIRRHFGGDQVREIVGMVADVQLNDRRQAAQPIVYTHQAQDGLVSYTFNLVVRTTAQDGTLIPMVRSIVRELDPEVPIRGIDRLEDLLARSAAHPRFYAIVLGAFAGLAVLLAVLGLYSLLLERTGQRRREIGIRMALGAGKPDLVRLLTGEGVLLSLLGVALGLTGAAATSHLFSAMLFRIQPLDPLTLAVTVPLLLSAALLATLLPAVRATRIPAAEALRL